MSDEKSSVYVIGNLKRKITNFDGEEEPYSQKDKDSPIVMWDFGKIITTTMKNCANDEAEKMSFDDRMRASKIGMKVRDTTNDEIVLNQEEYSFLMAEGKKNLLPQLIGMFMEEMDIAKKMTAKEFELMQNPEDNQDGQKESDPVRTEDT